ncbi:hypothetical protein [Streptomyces lasiicapitis]|uniref:Lipoprotein n=1 Tax=Streptomyces lasiicapitis TaxID=1923961 RepID=A0ABQ2LI73_9ACTN|nr:hypothetical protein [Streptomyces lasiicapitis]GGO34708.1 hypothetical protein GCM10012286_04190 [Streptomyces lasiicapitis]
MRKLILSLCAVLTLFVLVACDSVKTHNPTPVSMPSGVPKGPQFTKADDVVVALAKEGIGCEILRRSPGGLDCAANIDGAKVEVEISVFSGKMRKYLTDSIAARREPPVPQTLVAAGNWYIWVRGTARVPSAAPAIAKALDAVVLKPKGPKTPKYPLPRIPEKPRYKHVNDLADALDKSVGCKQRKTHSVGSLECRTAVPGSRGCAVLSLHETTARRDAVLREAIKHRGVPAQLVTAGNWTINLCQKGLGTEIARELGGVQVSYDGR